MGIDLNLPNLLTIGRVFAIPIFVYALAVQKRNVALFTFIAAGITDYIDGYLARKWGMESLFGAFLDPVADKLMVTAALIMLIASNPSWTFSIPVVAIICREIAISALREWMAERNLRATVQVGSLGKWKTAAQMVAIGFLIEVSSDVESSSFRLTSLWGMSQSTTFLVGMALLYVAALLAIVSGYQYFVAAWPILTKSVKTAT